MRRTRRVGHARHVSASTAGSCKEKALLSHNNGSLQRARRQGHTGIRVSEVNEGEEKDEEASSDEAQRRS